MVFMEQELIQRYADYRRTGGMKAWKFDKYHAEHLLTWLSTKSLSISQLDPNLVNEYLCFRKSLGWRHRTLTAALSVLKGFLNYARSLGIIANDPTGGVCCQWLGFPGGYPAYQGILRDILQKPSVMMKYRLSLFAPYWEEHLRLLLDQGYSKLSIQRVLLFNFHFHRYLIRKKVGRLIDITPGLLKTFLRRQQLLFQREHGHPMQEDSIQCYQACIAGFLTYAFSRHKRYFQKPPTLPESRVLPNKLLDRYLDFCRIHKGLKDTSRRGHRDEILRLRAFLDQRNIRRVADATVADVDAFLLHRSKDMGATGLKTAVAILRSFFRYLHLNGEIPSDLARNFMSPCRFRCDLRPKYLPWSKIQQFLAGIDRSQAGGKRDYAILTLLAYHGLRSQEAARLKINDVDWNNRCLLLRERKNGATVRLPLSQQAAAALEDYLSARPACAYQEIFLTRRAPIKPLGSSLCFVAERGLEKRFGRLLPRQGAHVLRHSFAKALLDRGAKLPDIATLLGHNSLRSTLVYTRVATEELREVSDNYAALLPGSELEIPKAFP